MKEEELDIKLLLLKLLKYWYVFAIIFPLPVLAGYYYLRYTQPKYEASVLFLIKDEKGSGQLNEESAFAEIGLGIKQGNLKNEMLILKSSPLMQRVVENLELQYNYVSLASFRKENLYKKSPIRILDWQPKENEGWLYAELVNDGAVRFSLTMAIDDEEREFKGEFGKELQLPTGKLILSRTGSKSFDYPIALQVTSQGYMAQALAGSLNVSEVDKESSILALSIRDVAPERARDILMELVTVYNESTVEEKNHVYENTIDLINERIQLIAGELSDAEQEVASYKRQFNMVALSAEGSLLMNELAASNKEVSSKEVQTEILNSIEDFLVKNRDNFQFVPTNMTINNLTLTNQLTSFNQLLAEQDRLKSDLGPSHPDLLLGQRQIQNLRETIIDNIRSIKADLKITRNASQELRNNLESRLRSLPQRERELIEIERRKNIKENLYLYLLQKREESVISLAVTAAKGKIVEPAQIPNSPVSPNRRQIWVVAVFMGLALPAGIVFLAESLNDKIQHEDDLSSLTSVPVIGAIGQHKSPGHLVINENSRTAIAEMFRLLRTNLAYVTPGKHLQSILVTSSISGEGKSFLALNLGMTLALTGKKILILELDLRRPKQAIYTNLKHSKEGIANYLVDTSMDSYQVIRNSGLHPNLDIISSGPMPPNPSELILSERLRELVRELRQRYDLIMVDAPPIGMVADALQLKDIVDASMYVMRIGITRRGHLQIIEDVSKRDKLPRPFIVLNGVPMNKRSYYGNGAGYGYSYGYGYEGNGYYEKDKKGILAKLRAAIFSLLH